MTQCMLQQVRKTMKAIFEYLRKISGGSLSQKQVNATNIAIAKASDTTIADMLGLAAETGFTITSRHLIKIYPNADIRFIAEINHYSAQYGITTAKRMAMFLANVLHESNGFMKLRESLAYSAPRLLEVFPTRVKTLANAQAIVAKGQSAIADIIYGGRYGNGTGNGDGFKYRGGGLIHTTFKENYKITGERIGVDLVASPERITEPAIAVQSAMEFWQRNGCNALADANNFAGTCKVVNGGTNGLTERTALYLKAKAVFGLD